MAARRLLLLAAAASQGLAPAGAQMLSGLSKMFSGSGEAAAPPTAAGGAAAATGGGAGTGGEAAPAGAALDLACVAGPRAAGWQAAKKMFRSVYDGPEGSPLVLPTPAQITAALDGAIAQLKAADAFSAEAGDECGLGRLCLQLMSMAAIEDPIALADLFQGMEKLASPVLTMLLDLPIVAIGQSGWPIYGLLSTINLRKAQIPEILNSPEVDGLADEVGLFFQNELLRGLTSGDVMAVRRAGGFYLSLDASPGSALAPLTALASQAIGAQTAQELFAALDAFQTGLRQVIGSAAELDIASSTRWPLWGMAQMSLDAFAP